LQRCNTLNETSVGLVIYEPKPRLNLAEVERLDVADPKKNEIKNVNHAFKVPVSASSFNKYVKLPLFFCYFIIKNSAILNSV
jgi:hypothetical protein